VTWANREVAEHLCLRGANVNQLTAEGDLIKTAEFGKREAAPGDGERYDAMISFLREEMAKSRPYDPRLPDGPASPGRATSR
jgi:hypothetical protein